jgi:hypothetical protein
LFWGDSLLPAGDDLTIAVFFLSLAFALGLEAMKAETPVRRGVFTALTAVCALTGVFWLQIKTIWPPFTEATTSVGTNPVAWFVVLMFILAVFAFHRPKIQKNEIPKSAAAAPASAAKNLQRTFIAITPVDLMNLCGSKTSIQADLLTSNYIGNWLRVSGNLRNMGHKMGIVLGSISIEDSRTVMMLFDKEWKDRAAQLISGQEITVVGEIIEIHEFDLMLRHCEIV